jgi:uncharacterized RDD family membrane protein YckC
MAKLLDLALVSSLALVLAAVVYRSVGSMSYIFAFIAADVALIVYTAVMERRTGQTLGKRLLGLRVAQESGIRISVGQSVVRQLPWLLNVALVDIIFALFTEKKQRAFELLSKTRVLALSDLPS